MAIMLPLDDMTVDEKWDLMELLYADLLRHGEELPSPSWHEQILREREERMRSGSAKYYDLDEVEKPLSDLTI